MKLKIGLIGLLLILLSLSYKTYAEYYVVAYPTCSYAPCEPAFPCEYGCRDYCYYHYMHFSSPHRHSSGSVGVQEYAWVE